MRSPLSFLRAKALSSASLAILGLQVSATEAQAQSTSRDVERARDPNAYVDVSSAVAIDTQPVGLEAADWSSIRAAYEANRHAVYAVRDGCEARNPGQEWSTRFDGRGFSTRPDAGGWSWGLELERYGFAGNERDVCEPTHVTANGQRVAYDWDATLQEWWINDTRGLEHGFTLRERPLQCEEGPLTFTLAVRGDLTARVSEDGQGARFFNRSGVEVLTYAGLVVLDADGQALPARIERPAASLLRLSIDERGARYPLTIDPLAQQAYLKASNTEAGDGFGVSVSVSGDTVVIGAEDEDSSATGVNGDPSDNSASYAGAAYVFVRNGSVWSQQAYLKASNTDAGDRFGRAVSISGDSIVVGAGAERSFATGVDGDQTDNSTSGAGAAYVFVRSGATWSQQAYLKASNTGQSNYFGFAVSVSADTIVVSAPDENSLGTGVNGDQTNAWGWSSGSAYVFVRNGTTWSQQAYLKASNTQGGDEFGHSVSVSGDVVVVGAWDEDGDGIHGELDNSAPTSGAAYVFVRTGTTWGQPSYLKAFFPEIFDNFGISVSVSGNTVVVGAYRDSSNATGVDGNDYDNSAGGSGAAYVFVNTGPAWLQQAYLKASNTESVDSFGYSVALWGNTLVISALNEDSSATGIDGDQSDNSAPQSGAAYVFQRIGSTWSQKAYLKASNTETDDLFGGAVAVSDGLVVISAGGENSSATGVGGDQNDNSAINAGAAYVYELEASLLAFCFGDGTSVACPCSNAGATGRGCDNSTGSGGALLTTSGEAISDTIVFTSTGELPTALSIFLQGTAPSGNGVAFGDGVRCVGGLLKRLYTKNASGGTVSAPTGTNLSVQAQSAALGDPITAGSTRYYQVYYRDPNLAFCPAPQGNSWNISNGIRIIW